MKVCSECGKSLRGKPALAKTCGPNHRAARSRRLTRERNERLAANLLKGDYTPEQRQVADMVNASKDVVRDVLRDEVTPIVREALTDDVLVGIRDLVRLAPKMIAAIEQDLTNSDDNVRQKAYSLLAKYTLGNPSIAPAPTTPATAPMEIFFAMPRPGDTTAPTTEATATELKTCVECQTEKDEALFVGNSDRCQDCHDSLQATVTERYGDA